MADLVRVLAIGGPTATGKTALSVQLAKRLNGEIICADSMQIYKGLDVGTAKVTPEEMQGVPHHLVGFLAPEEDFSVADYVALAQSCISDIAARGKLPILVGGTGLYLESLLRGVRFAPQPACAALRSALQAELAQKGAPALLAELAREDPDCAAQIHPNNTKRLLRALELWRLTHKTQAARAAQSLPVARPYRDTLVCLTLQDRARLYARIDARVDVMLQNGLLAEAQHVYENRAAYRTAAQAIGYKEFFAYFEAEQPLEACVARVKQASRNYAKRQLTWFSRMEGVHWLEADAPERAEQVEVWMSRT